MGFGKGKGSMGCGASLSRIILIIFNIVFFILGIASLAVGIWVLVDNKSFLQLTKMGMTKVNNNASAEVSKAAENYVNSPSLLQAGAYTMITLGAFNFVVGFCGCFGAIKLSKCLLFIYAFLVGLILIIEIVGAILAAVFQNKIESKLEEQLLLTLKNYYLGQPATTAKLKSTAETSISLAWDYAHVLIGCCGVNGISDFINSTGIPWTKNKNYTYDGKTYTGGQVFIPSSCCMMKDQAFAGKGEWVKIQENMKNPLCPIGSKNGTSAAPVDYNKKGCVTGLKDKIKKYATVVIAVGVTIGVIELFVIICACCLISAIKREND